MAKTVSVLVGVAVVLLTSFVSLVPGNLLVIAFISAVWVTKLFIHPTRVTSLAEFYTRLHVGDFIPSWLVAASALIFLVSAALLGLTCPSAEKLEDWSVHYHRQRAQDGDGE